MANDLIVNKDPYDDNSTTIGTLAMFLTISTTTTTTTRTLITTWTPKGLANNEKIDSSHDYHHHEDDSLFTHSLRYGPIHSIKSSLCGLFKHLYEKKMG
ncbi:hypothetical protein E2C01_089133 [Portunus trituberculatus]|uniref:Uncharacterized protein n=1 Tax=Portunus trituberculatus TaxID=210409 RepID=A0A5B7JHX9_PORTR|nr:hypothetical protein [Portunus trituberculatus]